MQFPAAGYTSTVANEGEAKAALEDTIAATKQIPGAGVAETTLTIASGSVTPTLGVQTIDTEGAAATDDLTNIVQTNLPDGSMLLIRIATSSRVVVVKHSAGGAGQVSLKAGVDLTLRSTSDWLLLKRTGALWEEVLFSPSASGVRILDRDVTVVDVTSTVTETSVYSFPVPANTLGTTGAIRLTFMAGYTNNTATPRLLTGRIKYGATTIASFGAGTNGFTPAVSAIRRPVLIEAMLSALAATNAQVCQAKAGVGAPDVSGVSGGVSADVSFHNAIAEDSTLAKTLSVTVQHAFADPLITIRAYVTQVELL